MAAAEVGLSYRQDRDATLGRGTTLTALSVFREPERLVTLGIREHLGGSSLQINPNPYGISGVRQRYLQFAWVHVSPMPANEWDNFLVQLNHSPEGRPIDYK